MFAPEVYAYAAMAVPMALLAGLLAWDLWERLR